MTNFTPEIFVNADGIVSRREYGDNFFLLPQIYLSRGLACRAAAHAGGKERLPIINSPFAPCPAKSGKDSKRINFVRTCEIAGLSRGVASQRRLSQWIQRLTVFTAFSHPHFIHAVAYTSSSRWSRGHRYVSQIREKIIFAVRSSWELWLVFGPRLSLPNKKKKRKKKMEVSRAS